MNGSPAIWLENRVHRAHSTQRSRSSSTCADRLIGLGKVRLTSVEAGVGAAVGHRLVLQRAFAALVADRAVQRMVDQQQFHHAVLGLVGGLGGELGAHHHVGRDGDGARRHRLALALDLDQALPAGADRLQQRMVAEPRDLHAHQLGGANHQRALGHADLVVVDGQCHHLDRRLGRRRGLVLGGGHTPTPSGRGEHRGVRDRTGTRRRGGPRTRRGST